MELRQPSLKNPYTFARSLGLGIGVCWGFFSFVSESLFASTISNLICEPPAIESQEVLGPILDQATQPATEPPNFVEIGNANQEVAQDAQPEEAVYTPSPEQELYSALTNEYFRDRPLEAPHLESLVENKELLRSAAIVLSYFESWTSNENRGKSDIALIPGLKLSEVSSLQEAYPYLKELKQDRLLRDIVINEFVLKKEHQEDLLHLAAEIEKFPKLLETAFGVEQTKIILGPTRNSSVQWGVDRLQVPELLAFNKSLDELKAQIESKDLAGISSDKILALALMQEVVDRETPASNAGVVDALVGVFREALRGKFVGRMKDWKSLVDELLKEKNKFESLTQAAQHRLLVEDIGQSDIFLTAQSENLSQFVSRLDQKELIQIKALNEELEKRLKALEILKGFQAEFVAGAIITKEFEDELARLVPSGDLDLESEEFRVKLMTAINQRTIELKDPEFLKLVKDHLRVLKDQDIPNFLYIYHENSLHNGGDVPVEIEDLLYKVADQFESGMSEDVYAPGLMQSLATVLAYAENWDSRENANKDFSGIQVLQLEAFRKILGDPSLIPSLLKQDTKESLRAYLFESAAYDPGDQKALFDIGLKMEASWAGFAKLFGGDEFDRFLFRANSASSQWGQEKFTIAQLLKFGDQMKELEEAATSQVLLELEPDELVLSYVMSRLTKPLHEALVPDFLAATALDQSALANLVTDRFQEKFVNEGAAAYLRAYKKLWRDKIPSKVANDQEALALKLLEIYKKLEARHLFGEDLDTTFSVVVESKIKDSNEMTKIIADLEDLNTNFDRDFEEHMVQGFSKLEANQGVAFFEGVSPAAQAVADIQAQSLKRTAQEAPQAYNWSDYLTSVALPQQAAARAEVEKNHGGSLVSLSMPIPNDPRFEARVVKDMAGNKIIWGSRPFLDFGSTDMKFNKFGSNADIERMISVLSGRIYYHRILDDRRQEASRPAALSFLETGATRSPGGIWAPKQWSKEDSEIVVNYVHPDDEVAVRSEAGASLAKLRVENLSYLALITDYIPSFPLRDPATGQAYKHDELKAKAERVWRFHSALQSNLKNSREIIFASWEAFRSKESSYLESIANLVDKAPGYYLEELGFYVFGDELAERGLAPEDFEEAQAIYSSGIGERREGARISSEKYFDILMERNRRMSASTLVNELPGRTDKALSIADFLRGAADVEEPNKDVDIGSRLFGLRLSARHEFRVNQRILSSNTFESSLREANRKMRAELVGEAQSILESLPDSAKDVLGRSPEEMIDKGWDLRAIQGLRFLIYRFKWDENMILDNEGQSSSLRQFIRRLNPHSVLDMAQLKALAQRYAIREGILLTLKGSEWLKEMETQVVKEGNRQLSARAIAIDRGFDQMRNVITELGHYQEYALQFNLVNSYGYYNNLNVVWADKKFQDLLGFLARNDVISREFDSAENREASMAKVELLLQQAGSVVLHNQFQVQVSPKSEEQDAFMKNRPEEVRVAVRDREERQLFERYFDLAFGKSFRLVAGRAGESELTEARRRDWAERNGAGNGEGQGDARVDPYEDRLMAGEKAAIAQREMRLSGDIANFLRERMLSKEALLMNIFADTSDAEQLRSQLGDPGNYQTRLMSYLGTLSVNNAQGLLKKLDAEEFIFLRAAVDRRTLSFYESYSSLKDSFGSRGRFSQDEINKLVQLFLSEPDFAKRMVPEIYVEKASQIHKFSDITISDLLSTRRAGSNIPLAPELVAKWNRANESDKERIKEQLSELRNFLFAAHWLFPTESRSNLEADLPGDLAKLEGIDFIRDMFQGIPEPSGEWKGEIRDRLKILESILTSNIHEDKLAGTLEYLAKNGFLDLQKFQDRLLAYVTSQIGGVLPDGIDRVRTIEEVFEGIDDEIFKAGPALKELKQALTGRSAFHKLNTPEKDRFVNDFGRSIIGALSEKQMLNIFADRDISAGIIDQSLSELLSFIKINPDLSLQLSFTEESKKLADWHREGLISMDRIQELLHAILHTRLMFMRAVEANDSERAASSFEDMRSLSAQIVLEFRTKRELLEELPQFKQLVISLMSNQVFAMEVNGGWILRDEWKNLDEISNRVTSFPSSLQEIIDHSEGMNDQALQQIISQRISSLKDPWYNSMPGLRFQYAYIKPTHDEIESGGSKAYKLGAASLVNFISAEGFLERIGHNYPYQSTEALAEALVGRDSFSKMQSLGTESDLYAAASELNSNLEGLAEFFSSDSSEVLATESILNLDDARIILKDWISRSRDVNAENDLDFDALSSNPKALKDYLKSLNIDAGANMPGLIFTAQQMGRIKEVTESITILAGRQQSGVDSWTRRGQEKLQNFIWFQEDSPLRMHDVASESFGSRILKEVFGEAGLANVGEEEKFIVGTSAEAVGEASRRMELLFAGKPDEVAYSRENLKTFTASLIKAREKYGPKLGWNEIFKDEEKIWALGYENSNLPRPSNEIQRGQIKTLGELLLLSEGLLKLNQGLAVGASWEMRQRSQIKTLAEGFKDFAQIINAYPDFTLENSLTAMEAMTRAQYRDMAGAFQEMRLLELTANPPGWFQVRGGIESVVNILIAIPEPILKPVMSAIQGYDYSIRGRDAIHAWGNWAVEEGNPEDLNWFQKHILGTEEISLTPGDLWFERLRPDWTRAILASEMFDIKIHGLNYTRFSKEKMIDHPEIFYTETVVDALTVLTLGRAKLASVGLKGLEAEVVAVTKPGVFSRIGRAIRGPQMNEAAYASSLAVTRTAEGITTAERGLFRRGIDKVLGRRATGSRQLEAIQARRLKQEATRAIRAKEVNAARYTAEELAARGSLRAPSPISVGSLKDTARTWRKAILQRSISGLRGGGRFGVSMAILTGPSLLGQAAFMPGGLGDSDLEINTAVTNNLVQTALFLFGMKLFHAPMGHRINKMIGGSIVYYIARQTARDVGLSAYYLPEEVFGTADYLQYGLDEKGMPDVKDLMISPEEKRRLIGNMMHVRQTYVSAISQMALSSLMMAQPHLSKIPGLSFLYPEIPQQNWTTFRRTVENLTRERPIEDMEAIREQLSSKLPDGRTLLERAVEKTTHRKLSLEEKTKLQERFDLEFERGVSRAREDMIRTMADVQKASQEQGEGIPSIVSVIEQLATSGQREAQSRLKNLNPQNEAGLVLRPAGNSVLWNAESPEGLQGIQAELARRGISSWASLEENSVNRAVWEELTRRMKRVEEGRPVEERFLNRDVQSLLGRFKNSREMDELDLAMSIYDPGRLSPKQQGQLARGEISWDRVLNELSQGVALSARYELMEGDALFKSTSNRGFTRDEAGFPMPLREGPQDSNLVRFNKRNQIQEDDGMSVYIPYQILGRVNEAGDRPIIGLEIRQTDSLERTATENNILGLRFSYERQGSNRSELQVQDDGSTIISKPDGSYLTIEKTKSGFYNIRFADTSTQGTAEFTGLSDLTSEHLGQILNRMGVRVMELEGSGLPFVNTGARPAIAETRVLRSIRTDEGVRLQTVTVRDWYKQKIEKNGSELSSSTQERINEDGSVEIVFKSDEPLEVQGLKSRMDRMIQGGVRQHSYTYRIPTETVVDGTGQSVRLANGGRAYWINPESGVFHRVLANGLEEVWVPGRYALAAGEGAPVYTRGEVYLVTFKGLAGVEEAGIPKDLRNIQDYDQRYQDDFAGRQILYSDGMGRVMEVVKDLRSSPKAYGEYQASRMDLLERLGMEPSLAQLDVYTQGVREADTQIRRSDKAHSNEIRRWEGLTEAQKLQTLRSNLELQILRYRRDVLHEGDAHTSFVGRLLERKRGPSVRQREITLESLKESRLAYDQLLNFYGRYLDVEPLRYIENDPLYEFFEIKPKAPEWLNKTLEERLDVISTENLEAKYKRIMADNHPDRATIRIQEEVRKLQEENSWGDERAREEIESRLAEATERFKDYQKLYETVVSGSSLETVDVGRARQLLEYSIRKDFEIEQNRAQYERDMQEYFKILMDEPSRVFPGMP